LYSHLRLVIAASLIAFGSVIAVGVPALFLTVDRPLVTRAEMSDPRRPGLQAADLAEF
jgi:hypothetical protein